MIYEFSIKPQTNGCFVLVINKRKTNKSRLESNVKRIHGYKSISAAEADQPRYEANITPLVCSCGTDIAAPQQIQLQLHRYVMNRAVLLVELHKDRHRYSRI